MFSIEMKVTTQVSLSKGRRILKNTLKYAHYTLYQYTQIKIQKFEWSETRYLRIFMYNEHTVQY